MKDWTNEYIMDTNYTCQFFPELNPSLMSFVLLEKGFYPPSLKKFNYCQLGCGNGFSANILAAANPKGEFWGIDFNPSQIAQAKLLANDAQSENIHLLNCSFEEFLDIETPQFDFMVLHEVYSYIGNENRHLLLELLRRKLKVGGVVYVNYNTLPGLSSILPLRDLIFEYAQQTFGTRLTRIEKAIAFVDKLQQMKPLYFLKNPDIIQKIEEIKHRSLTDVADEYFGRDWYSFYHFQVVEELAKAKLSFVSSADLKDPFNNLSLKEEQLKFLAEIANLPIYETVRDYFLNRPFRRDIFIKGPIKLTIEQQSQLLSNLKFALMVDPQHIKYELKLGTAKITLKPEIYNPLINALVNKFCNISELMEKSSSTTNTFVEVLQALKILVSNGSVMPILSDRKFDILPESSIKFNSAVFKQVQFGGNLQALASPVIGSGFPVERLEQLFFVAYQQKLEPVSFAWEIMENWGYKFKKEGEIIQAPEDNKAQLEERVQWFLKFRLPLFKKLLGITN